MPSVYAHYRFGFRMLPKLEPEVRKVIKRHRQMYDIGLHGPDIFFYHNIFRETPPARMGDQLHMTGGRQVLGRMAKRLRLESSESGLAYLYGLLGHYCLDSHCHPMVNANTENGVIGHVQLETEFNRYLLALDGKKCPRTFDCSRHMVLAEEDCAVIAGLYPGVTAADVKKSISTFAAVTHLLASPWDGLRSTAKKALGRGKFSQFIMFDTPDGECAHLMPELLALYEQAEADYPAMAGQLTAHLTCGVPLGEMFDPIFG